MATLFGKFIRKLRIDKGEILGQMADAMKVSSAYLSAVENGKRNITPQFIDGVIKHFNLNSHDAGSLREAADKSPVSVKINLQNSTDRERMLVSAFAQRVHSLSPSQQDQFLDSLNNLKNKDIANAQEKKSYATKHRKD